MEINILDTLSRMAAQLGKSDDVSHWKAMKPAAIVKFHASWQSTAPHYWGGSVRVGKDVWDLACMWAYSFPDQWAKELVDYWVMNSKNGFLGEVPLNIRAKDSRQISPFVVNTINTWIAVEGMFRHQADAEAIYCTLAHIRGMNRDFGFPVAPEAWDQNYKPWGDMYYGWDEPMVLLLIERIAGIDFSVVDHTFTVADHLPEDWAYVEIVVPITNHEHTEWTRVKISRELTGGHVTKTVVVEGNTQAKMLIQPWLEERQLLSKCTSSNGHADFSFYNAKDRTVTISLCERSDQQP